MYVVLTDFADREDGFYLYRAGDSFPRSGVDASPKRINALLTSENGLKKPLIAKADKSTGEEKKPENKAVDAPEDKPARRRVRKAKEE